jgi:hypothetical protein
MSKGEYTVKWIKGQRISWLGHLERMEEYRMAKKIFTQQLEGTGRRGRPRKGWREEVERELQVLGVRKWRELMIDRGKWRGIVQHRPPLWSSGQSFWLQIQRSPVRFPALPDFLSSSGSGTGSTHPHEVN